nr:hypothetical protein [Planctomycetales bacterium]NIM10337.1 hypothetical protein [Planctomycetales bacterium]NIN08884.1 hypothetical protein [Planctomycetales bacterium]NIN77999.1 hypothetical protein [Planctomycetales bacterium]NIO35187.1 hypothetical protein [Planctomycetales bacterium]
RANPQRYELVAETTFSEADPNEARRILRYPAWATPILAHGLLYVRGRDQLLCLELIPTQPARSRFGQRDERE